MNIAWDEAEKLNTLFVGKKIVEVDKTSGKLVLSDGTKLVLEANEGAMGCGCGDYDLTMLKRCNNAITSVAVEVKTQKAKEESKKYTLFVYTEHQKIAAAKVEGDDGTGYYGTGFHITVTMA